MMTCKEVARLYASGAYEEANWWQRFMLRLHLYRCPSCYHYAQQLRDVGDCARRISAEATDDDDALERLEGALFEAIDEHRGK